MGADGILNAKEILLILHTLNICELANFAADYENRSLYECEMSSVYLPLQSHGILLVM